MKYVVAFFLSGLSSVGFAHASNTSDNLTWQGNKVPAVLSSDLSNVRFVYCADPGGDDAVVFDLGGATDLTSSRVGSAQSAEASCHETNPTNLTWKSDQYKMTLSPPQWVPDPNIWFSDAGTIDIPFYWQNEPNDFAQLNQTEGECVFLSNNGSGGLDDLNDAGCE